MYNPAQAKCKPPSVVNTESPAFGLCTIVGTVLSVSSKDTLRTYRLYEYRSISACKSRSYISLMTFIARAATSISLNACVEAKGKESCGNGERKGSTV